jgi:NADH:ubiquinone oxidoreductase subunit C
MRANIELSKLITMTNQELKDFIQTQVPAATVTEGKQYLTAEVSRESLHQLALKLRDSEQTSFDYLFCLTGVDMPSSIMVVYHLESTLHKHALVLKTQTSDRTNPELDTVSDIWRTAEFHEREVFDLFGIKFKNHPDLRRLFMDDSYGFPLRKDHVDEVRIVER